MENQRSRFKTLAIFYYVFAGFGFLISLFTTIYIVLGTFFATNSDLRDAMLQDSPAETHLVMNGIGSILIVFGVVMFLFTLTISILSIYSGRQLARQKKYTFSLVFACFICVLFPFGTILGIVSLAFLLSDSAKAVYNQTP